MSDNLSNIISVRSFSQLVLDGLGELRPTKGSFLLSFVALMIAVTISVNMVSAVDSMVMAVNLAGVFRDVLLGIFGVALSFFAIFFSLLGGAQISRLILSSDDSLLAYLRYYENILVLLFLALSMNLMVSLLDATTVSKLLELICCDFYIEIICLAAYLFFSLRVVFEVKSLLFNTYSITRACIALKALEATGGHPDDAGDSQ